MEFDVFGRRIIVEREPGGWVAYLPGSDGKRSSAPGILFPPDLAEADLATYLADWCHEGASPAHPDVRRIR
jgi:hypothetical protein